MRHIPIVRAEPGMVLARDITSAKGHLLLRKGTTLNETYIAKLRQYGVMRLLIEDERTDDIEVPLALSQEMQLKALAMAEATLGGGKIPDKRTAQRVEECIEGIVADLSADPSALVHLMDLYTREDAMFYHAVNTCVVALAIGLALRANPQRLHNLGIASLMHDIGLSRVPPEVLGRGLEMTEEERWEFRRHPIYGYALLQNVPGITSVAARAVLQHHEWYDGNGYPSRLEGDKMVDIAKIIAVADYYDAHVSPQWYRAPMLPHEAAEAIIGYAGTRFDPAAVQVFMRRVAVYPLGSMVRLHTGQAGVVARLHEGLPLRPVLRVLREADGQPPPTPYDLDLLANPALQIAAVIDSV